MTNLEKLIQVLGETFPSIKIDEGDVRRRLQHCAWMVCPVEGECNPAKCPVEDFWEREYILNDLKPEPDAYIVTGYIVMVDDEGNQTPYSGCIHPTYSHAMDELDQAEYHGWITSIKPVTFRFTAKGGGKNA